MSVVVHAKSILTETGVCVPNMGIIYLLFIMMDLLLRFVQRMRNSLSHGSTWIWIAAIVLLILVFCYINLKKSPLLDQCFYTTAEMGEVGYDLNRIYLNLPTIRDEIDALVKKEPWHDWPEKELYANEGTWKVIPFYGFGTWVPDNCAACPQLVEFLRGIRGLRLATLSKLSGGMKLTPHKGWGCYSNYVIRCHFGVHVPPNKCYISVAGDGEPEEIRYHVDNEWLLFDDSKRHYAENMSTEDRIVLIIDIERPGHIKQGTSDATDTKELEEFVMAFKSQISSNQAS